MPTSRTLHPLRRAASGTTVAGLALAGLAAAPPVTALHAQLPGVPIAPGAFVHPGIALALDAGAERSSAASGGSDTRWTYGVAGGYAPASARWQLAGAIAAQQWPEGYKSPGNAVGARVAVPVWRGARFGASAVAGYGYARAKFTEDALVVGGGDAASVRQIPVGAALGARGAFGARAWALSVAPQLVWYRFAVADDAIDASRVRVGVLAEVALTARLGVGVAFEDGARSGPTEPGPRGSTIGLALSLALGER